MWAAPSPAGGPSTAKTMPTAAASSDASMASRRARLFARTATRAASTAMSASLAADPAMAARRAPLLTVAVVLAAAVLLLPDPAGAAQDLPVVVVPALDARRCSSARRRCGDRVADPGAGPRVSEASAVAALERGAVRNSLRGGLPQGPLLIAARDGIRDSAGTGNRARASCRRRPGERPPLSDRGHRARLRGASDVLEDPHPGHRVGRRRSADRAR